MFSYKSILAFTFNLSVLTFHGGCASPSAPQEESVKREEEPLPAAALGQLEPKVPIVPVDKSIQETDPPTGISNSGDLFSEKCRENYFYPADS
jgi:hypothetical protein